MPLVSALLILAALTALPSTAQAEGAVSSTPPAAAQGPTGDPSGATHLDRVGSLSASASGDGQPSTNTNSFTFTLDGSWNASDRGVLQTWVASGSLELKANRQVAGPPSASTAITISYQPNSPFAGEYSIGHMVMGSLDMAVFEHELNHAVHGAKGISNQVWEEGQARAAEVAEMNLLAAWGVPEAASYWDLHHQYSYDQYYANSNTPDVAPPSGQIWSGDPSLVLLRYEQAGYAFGKILIQSPSALVAFNAKLFAVPPGGVSLPLVERLLASVVPKVEGEKFDTWFAEQHIFDSSPPSGCRVFQRVAIFTVDVLCRSNGSEAAQSGVLVTYDIYDAAGSLIYSASDTTAPVYGWAAFAPNLTGYSGRLRIVASAATSSGTVSSTYWRPADPVTGIFGIVTNATTGTVRVSSRSGAFAPFNIELVNGAFSAPSLREFAGSISVRFSDHGKTFRATTIKDASDYSLMMTAS